MPEKKAQLTKAELMKLNRFLGFGDFARTDILFWGIEEGWGPEQKYVNEAQQHRAEIELRINNIAQNSSTFFLNGKDTSNAYWTTGHDFDEMRKQCYKDLGYKYQLNTTWNDNLWRQTWQFPARIALALGETDERNIDRWFLGKASLNQEQIDSIEECILKGVFARSTGIRMGLTDWRPVCRRNIKDSKYWPYEGDVDYKQYFRAFNKGKAKEVFYLQLRRDRLGAYKNILDMYHIPVIFCYGEARDTMIPLWKNIYEDMSGEELAVREVTIPTDRAKPGPMFWAKAQFQSGAILIIFTHHFTSGITLAELRYVTKQINRFRNGQELEDKGNVYVKK